MYKDRLVLAWLFLASLFLHVAWLSSPNQVVFDEVHFGKFVSAYCCTHERIFDIHPPHAKLLIAGAVALSSYDGHFSFDHIGEPYGDVPVFAFRIVPALFGTVLPLICFMFLRQLGISRRFSLLGAGALLLDNAFLVQTRLIALDGVLFVATLGAVSASLAALRSGGKRQLWWWMLAGLLSGLAVGTKFTGLAVFLIIGLMVAVALWRGRKTIKVSSWCLQAGVFLLTAAFIYLGGWYLHFSLLTQSGSGDVWQIPTGHFWPDLVKVHQQMLAANYNLKSPHPFSSPWWSWPIMLRPVFYWVDGNALVYFLGNPAVWWGIALTFFVAVIQLFSQGWKSSFLQWLKRDGWIAVAGYGVSFAPLIDVPRVLFLYHYATPLLFSLVLAIGFWDHYFSTEESKQCFVWWVGAVILLLFCLFAPLTFGWDVPSFWTQWLFWLPTWR